MSTNLPPMYVCNSRDFVVTVITISKFDCTEFLQSPIHVTYNINVKLIIFINDLAFYLDGLLDFEEDCEVDKEDNKDDDENIFGEKTTKLMTISINNN